MIKVFLIDDDELANELVVYILGFAGITDYHISTSGEDALKYLETCKLNESFPDVMFVDINMPGMNGFEFITRYEQQYWRYSKKTKVIMLTNSVLANEKKMASEHESISDLWNKPLTTEKLSELIESVRPENL